MNICQSKVHIWLPTWRQSTLLLIHLKLKFFLLVFSANNQNYYFFSLSLCPLHNWSHQVPLRIKIGFIVDNTLFAKPISSLSSSCHHHVRDLHRIRHTVDFTAASTIAMSRFHSWLDYRNSRYHSLLVIQPKRLQNAPARAVTRTPKHSHITPTLKSLYWLKVEQRILWPTRSPSTRPLTPISDSTPRSTW